MAKTRFTTPVMRMVQGSVDEPQTKDQQGNLRVVKTGPNAGQPNPQYYVGGAVAKNDPQWPAFWTQLVDQAMADFPNLFPHGAAGRDAIVALGGPTPDLLAPRPCAVSALNPQGAPMPLCMHREFAFKVLDGDGYDSTLKPNNTKEGFAGHWVVRFASSYPPRCFFAGRYAAAEQIQEKNAIRRGFYIRVSGTVEGNANVQRPGLYVNLDMIELAGVGPEIVSGPDAGAAFGGGPGALPSGATAMPGGTTPPPPPPPAAAADPMAAARADGWVAHPNAPGFHYKGQEVVADADVASRYAAPPPPPVAATPPPPPAPPVTVDPMAAARAAGWQPHPSAPGFHYLGNEVVVDADVAARFAAPLASAAPPPPPAGATGSPAAGSPAAGSPPPYDGFMGNATLPPAPGAPGAAPPPPTPAGAAPPPPPPGSIASPSSGPTMTAKANGVTYAAMIAAGWTDETLRAQGMVL